MVCKHFLFVCSVLRNSLWEDSLSFLPLLFSVFLFWGGGVDLMTDNPEGRGESRGGRRLGKILREDPLASFSTGIQSILNEQEL